eukprot:TRINITY_DN10366_c0_g1_i1.p1 TRINITY_DN10366_c0_g1~~TRINITY_DN10366_c0_g1_i1.p1  ORF type:complete len:1182 (+),score=213.41 TRINITY_DN10366_c0_g1_i1:2-3547(+)
MNRVQIWFVVIAGLLGIGVPFLLLGLELPNAIHTAILSKAAEYAILDEEDYDFWARIPGRTGMTDAKKFYLFECQNPDVVAARGVKPTFKEVGPFLYTYSHDLAQREYSDEDRYKNSRVRFVQEFHHKYEGNSTIINKEFRTLNLAGMKSWNNIKNKARFQLAIEGFFELFYYARNNLPRDMVMKELIKHYHQVDPIYELTKDLDIEQKIRQALAYDHNYGLLLDQNLYEWTTMCDGFEPYIEHEIMTYFGLNITQFEIVKVRFCHDYMTRHGAVIDKMCAKIQDCSLYNITYVQWFNGSMISPGSYKDYTFKSIFGFFEFHLFKAEFFNKINPEYKEQFLKVKWDDKSYHHLLDTLYEYPDYKTDEASFLLFDNMKRLFEAGRETLNPFKTVAVSAPKASEMDLSKFEHIAKITKLSKEQAFMMYSYFDYFVNNTVLLLQYGGSIDKERIAHFGSLGYKDLNYYYVDYLDLVIYTRSLHKRAGTKNCEEAVKFYFSIPETETFMPELVASICHNEYFNSDVSRAEGWKYFVEAVAFPYHFYWNLLELYLSHSISNFTRDTLEAMLFKSHSAFWSNLEDIKIKVKAHYNSHSKNQACENTFSKYCSKRQFFFTQFFQSVITEFPYPEADLPSSKYVSDWWSIIRGYVEYLYNHKDHRPHFGEPNPLPEKPIEVPVEFSWLTQYYGGSQISKIDLYNCFNPIGVYDTDVLYNIFLNVKTPQRVGKYYNFASMFFYNSTKYLLRNVEFGPMFDGILPESAYFGYYDHLIEAKHKAMDYLEGDDCTLNPWIGYNPIHWDTTEKTFEHMKEKHKMHTGADINDDIRKYKLYYNSPHVTYRKLVFDETGNECPFVAANPFTIKAITDMATDGFQFNQYPGKTPKLDTHYVIDSYTHRPLKVYRNTSYDYRHKDLEVNDYIVDFNSEYGCEKGLYVKNAIDMTSFFQMRSIVTQPRLKSVDEPGLIVPNIVYTYPIEGDVPPPGISKETSYYVVEPYTGITMKFEKKIMVSMVIYYDELYDKLPDGGLGEIMPYYSMYETGEASDKFIADMENDINSSQSTRRGIMAAFTIIGLLLIFSAIGMIARAFLYDDEGKEEGESKKTKAEKEGTSQLPPSLGEPAKEKLLLNEDEVKKKLDPPAVVQIDNPNTIIQPIIAAGAEDLQKEITPIQAVEAKRDDTLPPEEKKE